MFSIIGNQLTSCCDPVGTTSRVVTAICQLLDSAGAITLIALGALALTGQGGDLIAPLTVIPHAAKYMILGGLATLGVAYLFKPIDHNIIRATVREVLAESRRP